MIQNGHDFFSLCWHTHMWELVFYRLAAGHVGHNKWPNKGTLHRSFPGLKAVRFSSSVDDSMFKCFELPTRDLASWHSRPDKRQLWALSLRILAFSRLAPFSVSGRRDLLQAISLAQDPGIAQLKPVFAFIFPPPPLK